MVRLTEPSKENLLQQNLLPLQLPENQSGFLRTFLSDSGSHRNQQTWGDKRAPFERALCSS